MNDTNNIKEKLNFIELSVKQLREFASKNNIKVPIKAKKNEIIELLEQVTSSPDFIDRTKKDAGEDEDTEDLDEELIAGEEFDPALLHKEKLDLKFWQKPPYSSLLDSELAKESNVAFYDLASLVDKFFDNMLHEDLINYKISGIALKTSSTIHHYKISSIIREEEEIQKKEELEKLRQQHARTIPKALPQPIQSKLMISTKEELFDAMRSAIIETMQNREKIRRRAMRKEELKQQKLQVRSKAMLPRELLKHITGKEQTIEELLDSWYNKIKVKISLDESKLSFFELVNLIKKEETSDIDKKFAFVKLFLALMFLSTGNKLELHQDEDFKDFSINLK
jgi:hypothetical protein